MQLSSLSDSLIEWPFLFIPDSLKERCSCPACQTVSESDHSFLSLTVSKEDAAVQPVRQSHKVTIPFYPWQFKETAVQLVRQSHKVTISFYAWQFKETAVQLVRQSHKVTISFYPWQSQRKMQLSSLSDNLAKSSHCLGADVLMKLLANYCRNDQIRTAIRVGVVGKCTRNLLFFFSFDFSCEEYACL